MNPMAVSPSQEERSVGVFWQDRQCSLRMLMKSFGLARVALFMLAWGIGVSTVSGAAADLWLKDKGI